jgi:hypothetical protein
LLAREQTRYDVAGAVAGKGGVVLDFQPELWKQARVPDREAFIERFADLSASGSGSPAQANP